MRPGPRNLITDVAGIRVGNASDAHVRTGVTVVTSDAPLTAAVHVMGGAPGTRETDLLAPDRLVQGVDAVVLSGGSAFGLDAASGVMPALRAAGRGFPTSGGPIPIVPAAILYDLGNGGDKAWRESPYAALGRAAFDAAAEDFALGTEGAGTGALSAGLKGGLGSASAVLRSGHTVGAIAAANPVGSVLMGNGPEFRAWAEEVDGEFGGLGPGTPPATGDAPPLKTLTPMTSTTIAIVATDAALTKAEAQRIAIAAHDGIARAVWPAHLPLDGDLVFAVSTGRAPAPDGQRGLAHLGHAAACCLSRAIARGIYLARPEPGDVFPAWAARFG